MAKNILRGEHKVIDCICIKKKNPETQKYHRVSLKLRHWKAVVSAGLTNTGSAATMMARTVSSTLDSHESSWNCRR